MLDFSQIQKAGLTQQQFADLVGVERVTVNTWVRKRYSPRPNIRATVERALKMIRKAVEANTLPVPRVNHNVLVDKQLSRIRKALNEGV